MMFKTRSIFTKIHRLRILFQVTASLGCLRLQHLFSECAQTCASSKCIFLYLLLFYVRYEFKFGVWCNVGQDEVPRSVNVTTEFY